MDYFRNSMGPVEKCLRDSGIDKRNVHEVVLVGGSTRIPKAGQRLHRPAAGVLPHRRSLLSTAVQGSDMLPGLWGRAQRGVCKGRRKCRQRGAALIVASRRHGQQGWGRHGRRFAGLGGWVTTTGPSRCPVVLLKHRPSGIAPSCLGDPRTAHTWMLPGF